MTSHDSKPLRTSMSPEEVRTTLEKMPAEYRARLVKATRSLNHKVVQESRAGKSGYALSFADGSAAVVFVNGDQLDVRVSDRAPGEEDLTLIDQADAPDGAAPSDAALPYASAPFSLRDEVARSHGHAVTGIAVGEDTFNFCFDDGHELEAMFVPSRAGRRALRVFWEQW